MTVFAAVKNRRPWFCITENCHEVSISTLNLTYHNQLTLVVRPAFNKYYSACLKTMYKWQRK